MSDENQQVDIEDDENSPEELENPTQQTEDHDSANSGEDSSSPQSQTDEHVDPSDDATGNLFPEVQSDEESSIEPRTSEPRFFVFVEHYGAVGHVVDEQFDELESNGGRESPLPNYFFLQEEDGSFTMMDTLQQLVDESENVTRWNVVDNNDRDNVRNMGFAYRRGMAEHTLNQLRQSLQQLESELGTERRERQRNDGSPHDDE